MTRFVSETAQQPAVPSGSTSLNYPPQIISAIESSKGAEAKRQIAKTQATVSADSDVADPKPPPSFGDITKDMHNPPTRGTLPHFFAAAAEPPYPKRPKAGRVPL